MGVKEAARIKDYLTGGGGGCKMVKGLHLAQDLHGSRAAGVDHSRFPPVECAPSQSENYPKNMITGFNTDVNYKGTVFHVQTEDKGLQNPIIESLIYKGGEILGSRRLPYSEMMQNGYDEKTIVKLMEDQHKTMIEEIRKGKFDASADLLGDEAVLSDQSLDQVILNYLVEKKNDE